MARTSIKVKVTPGKSKGGTLIARKTVALKKSAGPQGNAFFETKAQLNLRLYGRPAKTQLRGTN